MIRYIISGQIITDEKFDLARRLRRNMTPQELRLWECLRGRRLAGIKFRRQQVIDGFVADFYSDAAGLVIELDGSAHDNRAEYDAARDAILARRGLRVMRVANSQIDNELPAALAAIEREVLHLVKPATENHLTPRPLTRVGFRPGQREI